VNLVDWEGKILRLEHPADGALRLGLHLRLELGERDGGQ
jgi:hypothetical protein